MIRHFCLIEYHIYHTVPLTIAVAVLILVIVFGNVLVIISVITSHALRAPQNLYLVSLACADILVATMVVPFSFSNELMGYWFFGRIWCEIYLCLDVFFCTSSIVHLCAISLDRYWSVTQAIKYNLRRTPCRIKGNIVLVWLLAALISFPPLITMQKEEGKVECPICDINEEKWYILFSSTASFFAPCIIMITVYIRIYQIAKKHTRAQPGERQRENCNSEDVRCNQEIKGREESEKSAGEVDGVGVDDDNSSSESTDTTLCSLKKGLRIGRVVPKPGESSPKLEVQWGGRRSRWKGRQNRERRFTFVLAVVMGAFVLCWFPFFFTYTLTALCESCSVPKTLFKLFFWFGYCNSSLNPIIYTVFNNDFRRSFKKILCRQNHI
uniref:Alpha-2A adrenergic receptor n=1 Tax=Periophthalmus magnuspinnatus TaxID=409849 RepID=A0A3B4ASE0_9GOBI